MPPWKSKSSLNSPDRAFRIPRLGPTADSGQLRQVPVSSRDLSAARAWIEDGSEGSCCPLRTAASVAFIREGADGLETFLTYRSTEGSPLGKVAFPGGAVQAGDRDPVGWFGPTPAQWAQKFGESEQMISARSAVVAAIRESFEEVGLLLAGPDDQSTVEYNEASETMDTREQIAAHEEEFVSFLKRSGLKLRTDLLKPLGRWQSPDFSHRRFDTHYFAAVVPVGQKPKLLGSKGIWGRWVNARDLLSDLESSMLGDEIDVEQTRGRSVQDLIAPGVQCILESLAASQTTIAFLTKKRSVSVRKGELVERDQKYYLEFAQPAFGCAARVKGI